jgi:hypothetical protein
MENLEEYIRRNREELDKYEPPSGVWKGIGKRLNGKKSPIYRWISIAAMITVIAGTAVVLYRSGLKPSELNNNNTLNPATTRASSQLKETEIYYNNLANSLFREATPMLAKYPEVEKELFTDISHLDSICLEIRKDLKDNVANEDVIEAMIQNYRIKIRLLEDMLTVLKEEDNNKEKNKSHEL